MTSSSFTLGGRVLLCLLLWAKLRSAQADLNDPEEIVRRSVEASRRDWKRLPNFDYYVRELEDGRTKTYLSQMLLGSRYNRLVAVDEKPLSAIEAEAEDTRFQTELNRRRHESPQERKQRIARYQKEIDRNEFFLSQVGSAFDFTLSGTDVVEGHEVYVLAARPRRGYHPPTMQAKALTGMQGTLWVNCADFHWVKLRAEVVRPVSIEGFLARVQRGTRFELDQAPTAEGLWLPSRFLMDTRAKVLFFFSHHDLENESYFDYRRSEGSPADVPR